MALLNIGAQATDDGSYLLHEEDHSSLRYQTVFYIQLATNIFFASVLLIRSIAFGLIFGEKTCLRDGWNIISLVVLIFEYFFLNISNFYLKIEE